MRKIYCKCGKYCGQIATGSKLLKGLQFACNDCEVKPKKTIFEQEIERLDAERRFGRWLSDPDSGKRI